MGIISQDPKKEGFRGEMEGELLRRKARRVWDLWGSTGVCGVLPGCSTWAVSQPFCSLMSTRWSKEGSNHKHTQLTGPDGYKNPSGHLAVSQSLAAGGWVYIGCWQVPTGCTSAPHPDPIHDRPQSCPPSTTSSGPPLSPLPSHCSGKKRES